MTTEVGSFVDSEGDLVGFYRVGFLLPQCGLGGGWE